MPISDWDVPFILVTPEGTLFFNEPDQTEGFYLLDMAGCESGTQVRVTVTNVPQAPGSIYGRGFTGGYVVRFAIQLWANDGVPACATTTPTSQQMMDLLERHVRSILNGRGRILYDPTGENRRLIDDVQVVEELRLVEGERTVVTFTLGSPFPYAIDFNQTLTQLSAGDPTAILDNTGSVPFYPVFKVYGPFSYFTLRNDDALDDDGNPLEIVYSIEQSEGAVPVGGGHYIEIDTFRNTVYLDGDGPKRMAGIDIEASDFWTLVVGENHVTIEGEGTFAAPDVDILWQPSWW